MTDINGLRSSAPNFQNVHPHSENQNAQGYLNFGIDFSNGDPIATQKALNHLHLDDHQDHVKTSLDRPGLNQGGFDEYYQHRRPPKLSVGERIKSCCEGNTACTGRKAWNFVQRRIPVIGWMRDYDIKGSAVSDLIGGLTVGIMQIPQGMGYALLAEMPPVMGLYVSLFAVIVYFFLGTSRHLSEGTFSVISLMSANVVSTYLLAHASSAVTTTAPSTAMTNAMLLINNSTSAALTHATAAPSVYDLHTEKVQLAVSVAFLVGVFQILMSILQLGSLSVYLSDTLVSAFTTGAAVHVFTSQIKYLLGIHVRNFRGFLCIISTYTDIVHNIRETNLITLGISISVVATLLTVNYGINERFSHKLIIPIPAELIVIVITTTTSYYIGLLDNYKVATVFDIPTGIPAPSLPNFSPMRDLALGSFGIAVVSFCICVSLSKIFAKRGGYDIDPNQEMFSYGMANLVGSFFLCFPSCASLSRSTVQVNSGSKTQLASLISCILIACVLLWVAPYFEPIPICVLSGIIVVALLKLFKQVTDMIDAWKISKCEAAIWFVTFWSVVFCDVDNGLLISIGFLLLVFLFKVQRPYTTLLGNIPNTETYLDLQKYKLAKELKGIKIMHFGGPMYFANREYFRARMYSYVFNPLTELARRLKKERKIKKSGGHISTEQLTNDIEIIMYPSNSTLNGISTSDMFEERTEKRPSRPLPVRPSPESVEAIIVDFSAVTFIDTGALSTLGQMTSEFGQVGVKLFVASIRDNILSKLERTTFYANLQGRIFPTIHDAVLHVTKLDGSVTSRRLNANEHSLPSTNL